MTAKKRISKAKNRERQRLRQLMGRPAWTPLQSLGTQTTTFQMNDGDAFDDSAEIFLNSRYKVAKYDDGDIIHLSIKRLDGQALQDWRELQRIKNELLGDEVEAVQLHPAESRLLDMCDQIHLWALKEGRFSFGFEERIVSEGTMLPGQTQRPFEEKPADLVHMADFVGNFCNQ